MSDPVLIAIVTTVGGIIVALVGAAGIKRHRVVDAIHEQVANDHSTNLRADVDQLIAMGAAHGVALDRLEDLIRAYADRVTALESALLLMSARLGDGEARFADLERHRLVVDDRLDGIAARLRKGDHHS